MSARLVLRRPRHADVQAILDIHRDPLACAHNPSDALATRAEAEELLGRWDEHWRRHGFGYWVVREAGLPLGFCGLKVMRLRDEPVLNLFYRFAPAHWGRGVASEAASTIVRWAATRRPGQRVIARVRPENVASARVAVRAGLVRAEHLDDEGADGLDWIFVSA